MDETCNDGTNSSDEHSMANDDNQNPIGHQSLAHAFQTYLNHDREEQLHWEDVCQAYRQYATFALCSWSNHRQRIDRLPEDQKIFLPTGLRAGTIESEERARQFHEAAIRNQFLLDCILRHAGMPHSQQSNKNSSSSPSSLHNVQSTPGNSTRILPASSLVADGQISKVSSVLKSLARDWSLDGKGERDQAYEPILNSVLRFVPIIVGRKGDEAPRICVPGAGVGRLALELAALGYRVQGNEFSLYMLLASDFILNAGVATPKKPMAISPWLLETRNVHAPTDVTRYVFILL
jgi:carnosine N-methyltransferase